MKIPELLAAALPQDCVTTEAWALQSYGCDRTTIWPAQAVAVVRPRHIDEVQRCVQLANEHGFALVPSGGRTGLSGGAVASNGEVVLSLERMNRIVDFDPVDASVRVEAGVVTAQLQDYARDKGLCYPVDFAAAGSSQIGGNIATNAGGIKVIRYGMTRDRVRGLSVVTGKGERLELNRGLLKNNTGYDFRHLFVGSEGTLGVICEATLALAPAPVDPLVLVLGVPRFADVLEVLASFRQRFSLSAFECFSDNGLRKVCAAYQLAPPLSTPAAYYALIEVDECDGAAEQAVAAFGKIRTNHFGKWVLRPAANSNRGSVPPAHIWVFENPDEIMHVHWAVHVPPGGETDFESRLPKWVERATGGTVADGALDMRPVHDVGRLALYFLKGADEAYTTYSNIRYEPQGVIDATRQST